MVRRMLLCLAFVFVAQLAVAGDTKDGTVKSVAGSSFVVTDSAGNKIGRASCRERV